MFFVLFLQATRAQTLTTETVLPVTTYTVDSSTDPTKFVVKFNRTAAQLTPAYQYTLVIQNADGLPHTVTEVGYCNTLPIADRQACKDNRQANQDYINNVRVKKAVVTLNTVELVNKDIFDKNVMSLEVPLTQLTTDNKLVIKVTGTAGAYIQLSLIATITTNEKDPPIVTSTTSSNTLTNNPTTHFSVSDASNTTSNVYLNNVLVLTTPLKEFDVTLTEGVNNISILSQDQYNNVAAPFNLSNVTLDTTPPVVSSNLQLTYYLNAFPNVINLQLTSNEALSQLNVNNLPATYNAALGYFTFPLTVTSAGFQSFQIDATDLAGNTSSSQLSFNIILDNTPPVITLPSDLPVMVNTNSYSLHIIVTDDNATQTTVKVNDVYSAPFSEKDFTYLIDFSTDGNRNIEISSQDPAGNITTKTFTISKNSQPFLAQIAAPLPDTTINSTIAVLQILGNKPIKKVQINAITYNFTQNKYLVNASVQLFTDGTYGVSAIVTDIFGATSTAFVKFQIKTNSMNAWNYQECRVE
ncbi:MAG: Ig-like domain-containing protein [Pseudobdellovibrio sp.]